MVTNKQYVCAIITSLLSGIAIGLSLSTVVWARLLF